MPIDTESIIDFLSKLAEEEGLRVTIKEVAKGGLMAGGGAIVGGLLGGPVGLAIGGVIGSCAAAATANEFKSVIEIIATMEEDKRECLAGNVRSIMNSIDVSDVTVLAAMVGGDAVLKKRVVGELANYFKTELSMAIVDH